MSSFVSSRDVAEASRPSGAPRHLRATGSTGGAARQAPRYTWLDSAKGLGIVLVVLGHASTSGVVNTSLYAFHMPLFFIISGLLFKARPLGETVARKARRLLVPYLVFALLTFAYWALVERRFRPGEYSVVSAFANIFLARGGIQNNPYNVVLWFLPCLFVTEMAFACVVAILRRVTGGFRHLLSAGVTVMVFVAFVLGYLMTQMVPDVPEGRLPFTLDIVPFAFGFYAIGYLAKPSLPRFDALTGKPLWRGVLAVTSVLLFAVMVVIVRASSLRVDLNSDVATSVPLLVVTALLGTTAMLLLCIGVDNPLLRYLGGASLAIMCAHDPIKRVAIVLVAKVLGLTTEVARTTPLALALIVALTIAVSLFMYELVRRVAPQALGTVPMGNE